MSKVIITCAVTGAIRKIGDGLGLPVASPAEARQLLQLTGADRVRF